MQVKFTVKDAKQFNDADVIAALKEKRSKYSSGGDEARAARARSEEGTRRRRIEMIQRAATATERRFIVHAPWRSRLV